MSVTGERDGAVSSNMRSGWAGALTSRLGRRFVLLFAVGALLPLIVFATLSVTTVSQQMRADLRATLHDAAKTSGMGLAARLGQVAGDLRLTADLLLSRRVDGGWSASEELRGQIRQHCAAAWLVEDGSVEALIGADSMPEFALSVAQEEHVAKGFPLVLLDAEMAAINPTMLMLLEFSREDEGRARVVAAINPSWFWDPQELRGANCQFAACDASGRVLYHTFRQPPANELLAASVTRLDSSGSLEWDIDGEPFMGRYWHAFLRPQYGVDLWVVQSRSQAEALAVGRSFERGFWLTAACTLLCVILAGLVTMRRTLDPIVSLRDATRRLGRGELEVRVDIEADDEFGELGMAFNDMAERLQHNILHRERTERELVASRDAALAAVKAKAEFVTNVSHEFRTPMAEILGATEILTQIEDDAGGEVREEFSEIALHGAKRLARLLDDVLELGETKSCDAAGVDLGATVDEAISGMPEQVVGRVRRRVAADLPTLTGDHDSLVATWRRLVDNAAKFSGAEAPIDVVVERGEGEVLVTVSDRGVGIGPNHLETVFDPFAQVDRDQLVDKAQGTGLGLTLAKAVVDAHGGTIRAANRAGGGAEFTVRLPAGRRAAVSS